MNRATRNLTVLRPDYDGWSLWRAATLPGESWSPQDALPEGTVLAVPAEQVRCLEVSVSPAEARHLARSLPFLIEEEVAEDIDNLHVASVEVDSGRYAVAVIRRAVLNELGTALGEVDSPMHWCPEPLLLPWQPGDCTLLVEGDRVLLRWGQYAGSAIQRRELPLLMASLPVQPERWVIYGDRDEALSAAIPAAGSVDWRRGHLGNALMLLEQDLPINLRQGEYAPRLPLVRWWQQWRPAAIAAGIAIALQFTTDLMSWQRLDAENLALREAIQNSYRTANPRGAVVDVEKQLDRQLAGLRGGGGGGKPFTPLLASVVTAAAETGDIDLATLNYSSNGDLRISMTAPDFAAVEALRGRLGRAGMVATIEGTSARGERISARLVVAGGV